MVRFWIYFEGQVDKWYKRKKRVKDLSKFLTQSSLRMELPFTKMEKTGKSRCWGGPFFHIKLKMSIRHPSEVSGRPMDGYIGIHRHVDRRYK